MENIILKEHDLLIRAQGMLVPGYEIECHLKVCSTVYGPIHYIWYVSHMSKTFTKTTHVILILACSATETS